MSDGLSRRQRKREQRARDQWALDLGWLMQNPRGRRIVANLLEWGHYGKNVFTGNSAGNFMQGEQAIANRLVAELKAVALPDFHRMEVESAQAAHEIAAQADDEDPGD